MTKDNEYHLIIYSSDGVAISHMLESDLVDRVADAINKTASVASRQGFISTAEIVEAAEKLAKGLRS